MGIIITRIQLEGIDPRKFNALQWMQFLVDVLRIIFLWPLVLFIEKSKSWLENTAVIDEVQPVTPVVLPDNAE